MTLSIERRSVRRSTSHRDQMESPGNCTNTAHHLYLCCSGEHLTPTSEMRFRLSAHEWLGAIASSIPKQQAALLVTEFRPIACICAKYSILLKTLDVRLNHTIEENCIIDDAQEAFRPGRSTIRQLTKIHSILHHERKKQESLSVILYLDIKNTFNAINHQAIFSIFEAAASLRLILPSFEECRRDPS